MTDVISRKAAIDALDAICDRECEYSKAQRSVMCGACRLESAFDVIDELPSAQPENIRCKDCKYWMPHSQLGFDEDNGVYHDYCQRLVPEDEYYAFYRGADDFCSRAERRTE